MDLRLAVDPPDTLVVHVREGSEQTEVAVSPARVGAQTLLAAVDSAMATGYGECFWPEASGGQYWWMFKRDAESLETIAMYTRGGASGGSTRFARRMRRHGSAAA